MTNLSVSFCYKIPEYEVDKDKLLLQLSLCLQLENYKDWFTSVSGPLLLSQICGIS